MPGFDESVERQKESAATERGARLSEQLKAPKGDVSKAAGEMERNSPLFRDTKGNPQGNLFSQSLGGPVGRWLTEQADLVRTSREIHNGLQDMDPKYDADVLRAVDLMKSLPGTPADQAQAYHALENPREPTTPVQRQIMAQLGPMRAESDALFRRLYPNKTISSDYVHRIAQQKGGLLDRILNGSQSTGRGNMLKRNASSGQKRSMMALQDPTTGDRQVVSVGRGRVTHWDNSVPTDVGALRSGMTTPNAELERQLAPLEREESRLQQEKRTLATHLNCRL